MIVYLNTLVKAKDAYSAGRTMIICRAVHISAAHLARESTHAPMVTIARKTKRLATLTTPRVNKSV
uniref:Uncharacterized protein n=1 Tax=Romanomermis culicivorax TaxID=13658 RepID=A0A915HXH8_ROMCU